MSAYTLPVYASPLTARRGSWLGHDRSGVQAVAKAQSAAEVQPLAFHKGERRRPGTGSLVTSRAWNIHKERYERVEKVTLPQSVCCWCTLGPDASRRRHRNQHRCRSEVIDGFSIFSSRGSQPLRAVAETSVRIIYWWCYKCLCLSVKLDKGYWLFKCSLRRSLTKTKMDGAFSVSWLSLVFVVFTPSLILDKKVVSS